jgi:tRNA threonylcarbamoyladenosine biosynthesis protein TsaE
MFESRSLILPDPQATRAQGARLGAAVAARRPEQLIIYLHGDLGSGKTTLARGLLEALGHAGRVPSPTYTLVEPYALSGYRVYHVDLYRITNPSELENLGIADQLGAGTVGLIEWPEHGAGRLPPPDLRLRLELIPTGRLLTCEALTDRGTQVLARIPLQSLASSTRSAG